MPDSTSFKNFEQVASFLTEIFSLNHIQELEDYYFEYSHNLRSAFRLVSTNPDCPNFFKTQQRKLKHPLPIDAYLLIPVQRIAKYPLLINKLVELYDHQNETRLSLLRSHSAVHHLMQAVNNRLHASAINVSSLPEDVAMTLTTGCHIHQQSIATVQIEKLPKDKSVEENCQKDKSFNSPNVSRTLRMSRPAQRRIFLTDKFLLLTKARENVNTGTVQDDLTSCLDTLPGGSEQYDFKDVFDLSLVENVSGYGKRVVVSMANLRYYLMFESESDRELWKEVLEYRKNKRQQASEIDTQGPVISSPGRNKNAKSALKNSKNAPILVKAGNSSKSNGKTTQSRGNSVNSSNFNRSNVASASSYQKNTSDLEVHSKSSNNSSSNNSVMSSFRRAFSRSSLRRKNKHSSSSVANTCANGSKVQREGEFGSPHNRQNSHSSDLGISTRSESSESGNSSNFTRNKVVTTSFRLRQSQLYSTGMNHLLNVQQSQGNLGSTQKSPITAKLSSKINSLQNSSESSASRPSSMNFSDS